MFLRDMMSNSVYADQMNSAQIQGQAAARERATRARQQALKDEQAMITRLEESAKSEIKERENKKQGQSQQEKAREHSETAEGQAEDNNQMEVVDGFGHIDLTA
jgi:ATPase subunit of ABC transporter with duplicated ATPase domains